MSNRKEESITIIRTNCSRRNKVLFSEKWVNGEQEWTTAILINENATRRERIAARDSNMSVGTLARSAAGWVRVRASGGGGGLEEVLGVGEAGGCWGA